MFENSPVFIVCISLPSASQAVTIAAEKLNILREQNVRTAEIEQLSSLYVEKEAMSNCSNFVNIRAKTLGVVNK